MRSRRTRARGLRWPDGPPIPVRPGRRPPTSRRATFPGANGGGEASWPPALSLLVVAGGIGFIVQNGGVVATRSAQPTRERGGDRQRHGRLRDPGPGAGPARPRPVRHRVAVRAAAGRGRNRPLARRPTRRPTAPHEPGRERGERRLRRGRAPDRPVEDRAGREHRPRGGQRHVRQGGGPADGHRRREPRDGAVLVDEEREQRRVHASDPGVAVRSGDAPAPGDRARSRTAGSCPTRGRDKTSRRSTST